MKGHIRAPKARKVNSYHLKHIAFKSNYQPDLEFESLFETPILEKRNSNPSNYKCSKIKLERIRYEFEENAEKLHVYDEVMKIMNNSSKDQHHSAVYQISINETDKLNEDSNGSEGLINRKFRANCIIKHSMQEDQIINMNAKSQNYSFTDQFNHFGLKNLFENSMIVENPNKKSFNKSFLISTSKSRLSCYFDQSRA